MTDQQNQLEKTNQIETIKGIITILGGLLSFALGISYFLGRLFIEGYYNRLNIPLSLVTMSLQEYTEWGGLFFFFGLLFMTLLGSPLIGIYFTVKGLKQELSENNLDQESTNNNSIKPGWRHILVVEIRKRKMLIVFCFVVPFLLYLFVVLFLFVVDLVSAEGAKYAANIIIDAYKVELISNEHIGIEDPTLIIGDLNHDKFNLYVYKDLHILTEIDGRLFLFKSIDPTSCKPNPVLAIQEDQIIYFTISKQNQVDIPKSCLSKFKIEEEMHTPIITPTSIPIPLSPP